MNPFNDPGVRAEIESWGREDKIRRLWGGDPSLWTGRDEARWLGWLEIVEAQRARLAAFLAIAADAHEGGFTHALLLGMGGSSLGPELLQRTFGSRPGQPALHVLDSTDPAQILSFEKRVDPARTLFIVSSKSGSTLEPNIYKQYFFERVRRAVGDAGAGARFIAITDPGSAMQRVAEKDRFRKIFFGMPSIGGRYSILSDFGMVPAAIQGIDVAALLDRAARMMRACAPSTAPADNPGLGLGAVLGVLGRKGRDKVTLVASPAIGDLGAWLEQLVAESTGKEGKGLIPVDREALGPPEVYGSDRLFIYLRLETGADEAQDRAIDALDKAGQPVVRIAIGDPLDLGGEFFRFEMATAVAGSILGINPFDQPDVEASKVATRALTDEYEKRGALPAETPILTDSGVAVLADPKNAEALTRAAGGDRTLAGILRSHLGRLKEGDYLAILAYIEMNPAHEEALQRLRHAVRDARRVATCLGFGPRFLHSTGQAYKGGPGSGVFLQLTCDDAVDLKVPGQSYTFGIVKAAQARGDFQVLSDRGRRALRLHLGKDVGAGLATLDRALREALG
ncbi:MAG TPA: bifunctional transaldolase/phosoglucose isomerase [Candidatus Polarisedimenticolia bacterium]